MRLLHNGFLMFCLLTAVEYCFPLLPASEKQAQRYVFFRERQDVSRFRRAVPFFRLDGLSLQFLNLTLQFLDTLLQFVSALQEFFRVDDHLVVQGGMRDVFVVMDEFRGDDATACQSPAPSSHVLAFRTQCDEHAQERTQKEGGNEGSDEADLALVAQEGNDQ